MYDFLYIGLFITLLSCAFIALQGRAHSRQIATLRDENTDLIASSAAYETMCALGAQLGGFLVSFSEDSADGRLSEGFGLEGSEGLFTLNTRGRLMCLREGQWRDIGSARRLLARIQALDAFEARLELEVLCYKAQ